MNTDWKIKLTITGPAKSRLEVETQATTATKDAVIAALGIGAQDDAWAHHTPKLLTEADAAADLAGEARPGAEPVAYLYHDATTPQDAHPWLHSTMLVLAADRRQGLRGETPLYTAPPQASQPVTRPGAEPVAWGWRRADGLILEVICPDEHEAHEGYYTVPLYTTPQASQPLTDGELLFHYNTAGGLISSLRAVQEAILSVNGAAQKGKP